MPEDKKISPKTVAVEVLKKFLDLSIKAEQAGKTSLIKSEKLEKKYEGFKAVEESARESGASDPAAVAAAAGRKKYGKKAFQEAAAAGHKMKKDDAPPPTVPGGTTINSSIGSPFGKSDENPDEKEDAKLGEKVEGDVEDHMEANKAAEKEEGHPSMQDKAQGHIKGHLKLAKWIGYMEGKRSKMGAQGPAGGVLENQSKEQEMGDSGNNEPTKKIDNVAGAMDKAETGREKGINTMSDPSQKSKVMLGTSKNGSQMPSKSHLDIAEAKEGHKQILGEMKNIKPKLPN